MDIVSLIVGVASVILAIVSIYIAKKESKKSDENYKQAKELFTKVEHKAELIDRTVQTEQQLIIGVINKLLEKVGQPQVDIKPISMNEIDDLFNEKNGEIHAKVTALEDAVDRIPDIHVESIEGKDSYRLVIDAPTDNTEKEVNSK